MITYLLNFVLCSGLLLLVYHVFLVQENLYRFNRFYLLFSLAFSLAVPLVTIQIPQTVVPVISEQIIEQAAPEVGNMPVQQPIIEQLSSTVINVPASRSIVKEPKHNYLPDILLGFYVLIAAVLLARFIRNGYKISRTVADNDIIAQDHAKLILLDTDITPHSFLNYIFINKTQYENGLIEPEIICHEQTHVKQLHSLDIILVELLQVICWFNPLIPLYRKAMQLNHEFLADAAVIKSYADTPAYQHLLLAKAGQGHSLYLTSQFNYLTTKKRLIMMTKTTSAKIALYKRLALLPVLAIAVLLFCHKVAAQTVPAKAKVMPATKEDAPKSITEEYGAILDKYKQTDPKARMPHLKFSDTDKKRLEVLFRKMSKEQQKRQWIGFIPSPPLLPKSHPTDEQITQWAGDAKYGVWINDKRVKNTELAKYKAADFDQYMISSLTKRAIANDGFYTQVDLMTKAYYVDYRKKALADTSWHIYHHGNIPDQKTADRAKYGVNSNHLHEVTQQEWKEIMRTNVKPNVGLITWSEVQAFIKKMNAKYGTRYRLLTEKELENAVFKGELAKGKNDRIIYLTEDSNDKELKVIRGNVSIKKGNTVNTIQTYHDSVPVYVNGKLASWYGAKKDGSADITERSGDLSKVAGNKTKQSLDSIIAARHDKSVKITSILVRK